MDRNLKPLVAVACVAVVAAVGYFSWTDWTASRAEAARVSEAMAAHEEAVSAMYARAEAGPDERYKVVVMCQRLRASMAGETAGPRYVGEENERALASCRELGFL